MLPSPLFGIMSGPLLGAPHLQVNRYVSGEFDNTELPLLGRSSAISKPHRSHIEATSNDPLCSAFNYRASLFFLVRWSGLLK